MQHRPNFILENRYNFNRRHLNSLHNLIYTAAENYSKILPIRIDLHLTDSKQFKITHEDFLDYWHSMQNNMRHNQKFKHLITYVAKLEYGRNRGWHMHVLMLFDGQYIKNDFHLSSDIGEYWNQTVKSQHNNHDGYYYACNMDKKHYHLNALKMIRATYALNLSKYCPEAYTDLDILVDACAYLTKIHDRTLDHFDDLGYVRHPRTIFFGRVKPKAKSGRPRSKLTR